MNISNLIRFLGITFKKSKNYDGIVTAAGFELPSEAIQLGQKLLIISFKDQMEQESNALALQHLNHTTIEHDFSKESLKNRYNNRCTLPSSTQMSLTKWRNGQSIQKKNRS